MSSGNLVSPPFLLTGLLPARGHRVARRGPWQSRGLPPDGSPSRGSLAQFLLRVENASRQWGTHRHSVRRRQTGRPGGLGAEERRPVCSNHEEDVKGEVNKMRDVFKTKAKKEAQCCEFFFCCFFFTQVQTPVTLFSGELWSILVVRLAHSADLRSRLRHVSSAPSVDCPGSNHTASICL